MSDLEKFQEEIESFLKAEAFNIFPHQNSNFSKFLSELKWSEPDNWEDFFLIAKKEEIATIFESIKKFSVDDLESLKDDSDDEEDEDELENIIAEFEANLDEIYAVSFSWIKNNIIHTITKQSSWFMELYKKIQGEERKKPTQQLGRVRTSYTEREDEEVPEKFVGKEEEIAKKFVEYMEVEHPGADRSELWDIKREFWESLKINNYSNKQRIFTNKVSTIADRIISNTEREMIPELVEKSVEWAIENKIDKLTPATLREFLAEKNISLKHDNFLILHSAIKKIIDKNEREMIPELVEKSVEWAIENKMNKLTQTLLRGFLAEKNISLSPENLKILHAKIAVELQSL